MFWQIHSVMADLQTSLLERWLLILFQRISQFLQSNPFNMENLFGINLHNNMNHVITTISHANIKLTEENFMECINKMQS